MTKWYDASPSSIMEGQILRKQRNRVIATYYRLSLTGSGWDGPYERTSDPGTFLLGDPIPTLRALLKLGLKFFDGTPIR